MNKQIQLPAGGCENCSKYEGETQSILRKRLVWDGSYWVCRECAKADSDKTQ